MKRTATVKICTPLFSRSQEGYCISLKLEQYRIEHASRVFSAIAELLVYFLVSIDECTIRVTFMEKSMHYVLFAVFVGDLHVKRMVYMVAGLTNDDPQVTPPQYKQYRYVEQADVLPSCAIATVTFPPTTELYRYVIIQPVFTLNGFCFAEAKIFLRGR